MNKQITTPKQIEEAYKKYLEKVKKRVAEKMAGNILMRRLRRETASMVLRRLWIENYTSRWQEVQGVS